MMTIIIGFLVLIIILYLSSKGKRRKENDGSGSVKTQIFVSVNGSEYRELKSSPEESNARVRNKKSLERLEERRNRHDKIWLVLRYMEAYQQFVQSGNFYDYQKNMTDYKSVIEELGKSHIDKYSIEVAIRFCRKEYHFGSCNHQLTEDEVKLVINWQTNIMDDYKVLKNVLFKYKEYWDSVLISYVRPAARTKRLQYLIVDLDKIMGLPDIQKYPDILQDVKCLQLQYKSQLSK